MMQAVSCKKPLTRVGGALTVGREAGLVRRAAHVGGVAGPGCGPAAPAVEYDRAARVGRCCAQGRGASPGAHEMRTELGVSS